MYNTMRVISGKARSIPLKTPKGADTRPTSDRTKETLFNVLQPIISGCRFLDLFSGSGGIGIEALSRGAKSCIFVEQNRNAQDCIRENLQKTKLHNEGQILSKDVISALHQLDKQVSFDCVFMDPPYGKELEKEVLFYLKDSGLIHQETWIVVEAANETRFDYLEDWNYMLVKEKKYKTNRHLFLKMRGSVNESSSIPGIL